MYQQAQRDWYSKIVGRRTGVSYIWYLRHSRENRSRTESFFKDLDFGWHTTEQCLGSSITMNRAMKSHKYRDKGMWSQRNERERTGRRELESEDNEPADKRTTTISSLADH